MNTVGTDVSMLDDDLSLMSEDADDNCSMMDISSCSKLEDISMTSADKSLVGTDITMLDADLSLMDEDADVSIIDGNCSMLDGDCSIMDVDSSSVS